MYSKSRVSAVASLAILLMLTGSNVAMAKPHNTLTLGLAGGFVDIGSQKYHSKGTAAVSISFNGTSIPSSVGFSYSIDASVQGTAVSGKAHFQLGGESEEEEDDDNASTSPVNVKGRVQLFDMIPAVGLPLSPSDPSNPLACLPSCTSAIPGFYVGIADIQGSVLGTPVSLSNVTILIESAYLSPFGGPIFIGTPNGSISIAATYDSAISRWSNVQTAGFVIDGNGTQVGQFAMKASLTENLLNGKERDQGRVSLFGLSGDLALLNSEGKFSGKSVVPKAGSFDCTDALSSQIGFTLPPKTCLATGSHSEGSHGLRGDNEKTEIQGDYSLDWNVPAIGFTGEVTATVEEED
ncbi:MAG: hypothetical protein E6K99_02720 [Thaumarchaeota archaeon]|nr:MAG: hypothetical protein E6K99_02720 [Nitrososphaerota archaeon]